MILMGILWVVFVLSLIAWGLGRRSSMEASVLETYRGKLRGYAAARAGLNYALAVMAKFPSADDSLYGCGIDFEKERTPEAVFARIDVAPRVYATIQWPPQGFDNAPAAAYGFQDEESKINVNAIGTNNAHVLSAFFELKGLERPQADGLAAAVVAYRLGNQPGNRGWLSDNSAQTGLKPKLKAYEDLDELREVPGMTPELFGKVKDQLTIYGDTASGLQVNMATASDDVLKALAEAFRRDNASANSADIFNKARTFRDGDDGKPFTPDDGAGAWTAAADWPPALERRLTQYLKARITGVDEDSGARVVLEAVIRRSSGSAKIVGWRKDVAP